VDAIRPVVPFRPHVPPPPTAWPHAAQLAAALLLGAAAALLAVRVFQGPAGRPLDLAATPPLDLNRADSGELLQLPGVGPVLANRIVEARDARGGFRTADDLRAVPGIGPARLERVRPWVRVDGAAPAGPAPRPGGGVTTSKKTDTAGDPVDVNRATADELQSLPGVGPKLAQRIIDERMKKPFTTIEDLRRVSGIGVKTLEKLRPCVTVTPAD
jgi:competence protein ComEA